MRRHHRDLIKWLREEYDVRPLMKAGGKHPQVEFALAGQTVKLSMPSSPSDNRWKKCWKAFARKTVEAKTA